MWRSCRWEMVLDGKHLQWMVTSINFTSFRSRPGSRPIQTRSRPEVATSHTYPTITATCSCLTMPTKTKQSWTTKSMPKQAALLAVKGKCSASLQKKNKEQSAPKRLAQGVCNSRPLSCPAPLIVTAPIPGQQTAGHTGNAGPYYREFRLLRVLLKCCDEIVSFKRSQDTGAKLDTETCKRCRVAIWKFLSDTWSKVPWLGPEHDVYVTPLVPDVRITAERSIPELSRTSMYCKLSIYIYIYIYNIFYMYMIVYNTHIIYYHILYSRG